MSSMSACPTSSVSCLLPSAPNLSSSYTSSWVSVLSKSICVRKMLELFSCDHVALGLLPFRQSYGLEQVVTMSNNS